jgi:hypothetical protein
MTEIKNCFLDRNRPCDLTCKAAFEVDDPVDNVDCYFIWLAHHLGESLFDLKRVVEGMTGGGGFPLPPGFGGGGGGGGGPPPGPKGTKGPPSSN